MKLLVFVTVGSLWHSKVQRDQRKAWLSESIKTAPMVEARGEGLQPLPDHGLEGKKLGE